MLVRVKSKDSKTVINALIKQAHKLPRELYKSLTWDRGSEMAESQALQPGRLISKCTSAIRKALGNVVQTKIPMVC